MDFAACYLSEHIVAIQLLEIFNPDSGCDDVQGLRICDAVTVFKLYHGDLMMHIISQRHILWTMLKDLHLEGNQ